MLRSLRKKLNAAQVTQTCAVAVARQRNRIRLAGASVLAIGLCATAAGQVLESELKRIGPPPLAMADDIFCGPRSNTRYVR